MKIAVVDDQDSIRLTFEQIFRLQNYGVECFQSAEELLGHSRIKEFDCLLIDFRLPGKNGIELLRMLRDSSINTPAILISGNMDGEFQEFVRELPDVTMLRKPCSVKSLLDTVKRLTTKQQE